MPRFSRSAVVTMGLCLAMAAAGCGRTKSPVNLEGVCVVGTVGVFSTGVEMRLAPAGHPGLLTVKTNPPNALLYVGLSEDFASSLEVGSLKATVSHPKGAALVGTTPLAQIPLYPSVYVEGQGRAGTFTSVPVRKRQSVQYMLRLEKEGYKPVAISPVALVAGNETVLTIDLERIGGEDVRKKAEEERPKAEAPREDPKPKVLENKPPEKKVPEKKTPEKK